MKPIRLRSNAFYFKLDDHQRACYNAGLPTKFMGFQFSDLIFSPYTVGDLHKKRASAHKQQQAITSFARDLKPSGLYCTTIAVHSAPTDESAFKCAATIFEHAMKAGLSCQCLSTSQLLSNDLPDAKDVYIIHGVNDLPNPQAVWALRDFIRDRDGSLRIVVMTSGHEMSVDVLIHERLRMHFDHLFCLDDNAQMVESESTSRRSRLPRQEDPAMPVARRLRSTNA